MVNIKIELTLPEGRFQEIDQYCMNATENNCNVIDVIREKILIPLQEVFHTENEPILSVEKKG